MERADRVELRVLSAAAEVETEQYHDCEGAGAGIYVDVSHADRVQQDAIRGRLGCPASGSGPCRDDDVLSIEAEDGDLRLVLS